MLRMALQIAAQVILARILGPEEYGIFAIGAIVIGFSSFLSDVGLAYGLIQKTTVDDRDLRFVFTWQVILGFAVGSLVAALSGLIAQFFGEPRAQPVIAALAVVCLLNALVAPSLNLLKRQLDFRSIQIANVTSYVAGFYLVGIPLALFGFQVWALALAWLVQAALFSALLYGRVRHALGWLAWYEHGAQQLRYARSVLATNLLNWLVTNIDRVVVGRVFGSVEIGLYATSFNLVYAPGAAIAGVVQPVFFSASSRMASDHGRMGATYLSALEAVVALALPAFAVVAALSYALVHTLFGSKWDAAVPLCAPLAMAMPMFMVLAVSTPVLWTNDRSSREFRLQLPLLLVWLLVCVFASRFSLQAVAWAVMALYVVRAAVMVFAACQALGLSGVGVWRACRGGVVLAIATAASALCADAALVAAPSALRLAGAGSIAVAAWLATSWLLPALLGPRLRTFLGAVLRLLPAPLARLLSYLGPRSS